MSTRKSIHFTSDWHLFHANSITFDQRPFKNLDHMHTVLVNNYNSQVPVDGVCYFLGDIGLSNKEALSSVMSRLNGTKIMVLGNHDKGSNAMYDIGFDVVLNNACIYIANERVTMSHCPLRGVFREDVTGMRNALETDNWHGESRHDAFSVTDEGQFHLHGHIHSGKSNNKKHFDGNQFDVGVPANNYRPVSIYTIESWIARTKLGHYK
jgi:calcineurin-like phosphoesterase family protein